MSTLRWREISTSHPERKAVVNRLIDHVWHAIRRAKEHIDYMERTGKTHKKHLVKVNLDRAEVRYAMLLHADPEYVWPAIEEVILELRDKA